MKKIVFLAAFLVLGLNLWTSRPVAGQTDASAPTISGFTPTSGGVGTVVTITGTNFTGARDVKFNATSSGLFRVDSATQITASVPSGATTGTISVTTPNGTATSSTQFTVDTGAPTITSFAPLNGPVGSSITITGTNFVDVTEVRFNATPATTYTVDSATQITAVVPDGATTGTLRVIATKGTAVSSAQFTVSRAGDPTIMSFSPTNGLAGTRVTIMGMNFSTVTRVLFNNTPAASFTIDSPTQLTAVVPSGASNGRISVVTNGNATAASADIFKIGCRGKVDSSRWRADYFSNRDLRDKAVVRRDDTQADDFLNFTFNGKDSPTPGCPIPAENFSARWQRTVTFEEGTYEFTVTSDDGVRLYIDQVRILNQWVTQGATTKTVRWALTAGDHILAVDYFNGGGTGVLKYSWKKVQ